MCILVLGDFICSFEKCSIALIDKFWPALYMSQLKNSIRDQYKTLDAIQTNLIGIAHQQEKSKTYFPGGEI